MHTTLFEKYVRSVLCCHWRSFRFVRQEFIFDIVRGNIFLMCKSNRFEMYIHFCFTCKISETESILIWKFPYIINILLIHRYPPWRLISSSVFIFIIIWRDHTVDITNNLRLIPLKDDNEYFLEIFCPVFILPGYTYWLIPREKTHNSCEKKRDNF